MTDFLSYLKEYLRNSSLKALLFIVLFVSLLIFINYQFGIESRIRSLHPWYASLLSFFLFYGFVLFFTWALQFSFGHPPRTLLHNRPFLYLLLLAPLYFSSKMVHWDLSFLVPSAWPASWNHYAQIVIQLPAKLALLLLFLWGCRKWDDRVDSFYGLTTKNFKAGPYFLLLLCMVPLIVLASTRPDFLHAYPKVRSIYFLNGYTKPVWPWGLLYEISYGLDFLSIELFFRGLLVIGLVRYAGPYVILPMAAFYCTVHFGKPLGECISSFFGGLVLGVIAWRTRSIFGGLIVHLGIAWLMELGGWLGNGGPG